MKALLLSIFLFITIQGFSQLPFGFTYGTPIPAQSAAQRVTDTFIAKNGITGNDRVAFKDAVASMERLNIYYKLQSLNMSKYFDGLRVPNLIDPSDYDASFRLVVTDGTVTTSGVGIVIGVGDTLSSNHINDRATNAPYLGSFWHTINGVSLPMIHSVSPFRHEGRFGGKAYTFIWASPLGVTVPAVPPGFGMMQRSSDSTVETYQNGVGYQEKIFVSSASPTNNPTLVVGNADSSFNLKAFGITEALTPTQENDLQQIINTLISRLEGTTATYQPQAGPQDAIWKYILTNEAPFETAMDGRQVQWYKNDTAISCGGWTADSTNNRVYYTINKGVTWVEKDTALWPPTNDFLFCRSVTGDTLVKIGGDNGLINNRRVDIYTNGQWSNLITWSGLTNGIGLTGCRHKHWYYMLDPSGDLYRLTLASPTPVRIKHFSGDTAIARGFMISLPSGRLIFGGGYSAPGTTLLGNVWYSDDDGFTWALLMQDEIFENYWNKATVTKTSVIFWKGRNNVSNLIGVYTIPIQNLEQGINLDAWRILSYGPLAVHAQGMGTIFDSNNQPTDEAIGGPGNFYNFSLLFKRIDL